MRIRRSLLERFRERAFFCKVGRKVGNKQDPHKVKVLNLMPDTKSGGTLLLDNERGIVVSEESELHVAYSAKTDKQIKSTITME